MDLEDRIDSPIALLSGGQRQAITLLMATLTSPVLLLLDEHTAALDPRAAEHVVRLTRELVTDAHLTTLMVTHSLGQAVQLGDRVLVMHRGRIVHDLFGRFPNLRVCLAEQGTVWLPYILRKLDHAYLLGRQARFGRLLRRPSEIFRDHFVVAPFPEENVRRVVAEVGVEPIVFGSDFPHGEGLAFPADYVDAQLGGLPDEQVLAIMRDNLARFLGIAA